MLLLGHVHAGQDRATVCVSSVSVADGGVDGCRQ